LGWVFIGVLVLNTIVHIYFLMRDLFSQWRLQCRRYRRKKRAEKAKKSALKAKKKSKKRVNVRVVAVVEESEDEESSKYAGLSSRSL